MSIYGGLIFFIGPKLSHFWGNCIDIPNLVQSRNRIRNAMLLETWDRSPGVPWVNVVAYLGFFFLVRHWPILAFKVQPRVRRTRAKIGPMCYSDIKAYQAQAGTNIRPGSTQIRTNM
jgi:hypothetical protein